MLAVSIHHDSFLHPTDQWLSTGDLKMSHRSVLVTDCGEKTILNAANHKIVPRFVCQLVEVARVGDANMINVYFDRLHSGHACSEDKPVLILLIKTNNKKKQLFEIK